MEEKYQSMRDGLRLFLILDKARMSASRYESHQPSFLDLMTSAFEIKEKHLEKDKGILLSSKKIHKALTPVWKILQFVGKESVHNSFGILKRR